MSTSEYDAFRPPEPPRSGRRRRSGRRSSGDGGREMPMVPEAEFGSYYGKPVVKPPPWRHEVAAYLFLGGLAGGSGLLAAGARATGLARLRRNAGFTALGAISLGGAALVKDLGRPERFLNMLRTFKLTSPMSVGSWIMTGFGAGTSITVAAELDRITGRRLPLGPLRPLLYAVEGLATWEAAAFGAPLAAYTAVLLSDTAMPTWNAAYRQLPFVFVSSASLASGGAAMVTTPPAETRPARALAVLGVVGDLAATRLMLDRMDPVVAEPLRQGRPGRWLAWAERLAVVGGLGTLLGGRRRTVAVGSGLCLLASSALTRFAVFEAGIESAKDPRYTVVPQRRRLEARGVTDDSITT